MIKRKDKPCLICGKVGPIWSKKRCKSCAIKHDMVLNEHKAKKAFSKKEKKESRSTLIKDLDDIFSIFIRRRNADDYGRVKCFTCPSISNWKDMDCGHYWSRKHMGTRWDEINCQVQCTSCNIFNQGAGPQFAANLTRKYGEGMMQMLEIKKNSENKIGTFELKYLIGFYKDKVASLDK